MNEKSRNSRTGTRYAWIGFAMGIACMAGLFIFGLAIRQPGMVAISSSLAAVLGATWSATHVAATKRAAQ
ncbi:hypothetical protein ACSYDW_10415 [Paeniglutamicibacter sp. R2-26]|uniref:hypothetical protein n=1 Tax=Paeniglutamicibacter sp. R2-26 TaxID=3144417 RepID=UPI003EE8107B